MARPAPRYRRDLPALHPAVAGCLWRRGRVTRLDAIACLLRLISDGSLATRPSVRQVTTIAGAHAIETTELRVVHERWDALDPLDKELLRLVHDALGGPSALTLADLQAAVRRRPAAFADALSSWGSLVRQRAAAGGLLRGRLRTRAGRAEYGRLRALYRFLRDFGTLEDEPPLSVELWGPYLAYAVVLGLGERVARELDLRAPGAAAHPDLAAWKTWFGIE